MPEPFQIIDGPSDARFALLRVRGRLDSTTASVLASRCKAAAESHACVMLNLHDVSFIASSGIGVLLAMAEHLRAADGELHLVALSHAVHAVIRLLNLESFLQIHGSEAEAIGTLKAA